MSKRWNRTETWLALMVLGIGGVIFAVAGLFVYMSATATPLHPDPKHVPSASETDPLPRWNAAVERGREIVRAGLSEQNLPGVSVAVGVGGDIVWAEGFGFADLDKRAPITPATRLRIGTASMMLTSAAAGLLLEKGQLKLDEDIQAYVPEYPKKEWPVTVRQLMGHVAGVRSDGGDEGPLFSQRCERPVEGVQHVAEYALRFEPGTAYRFSNFGWIMVSAAIETAAKEPFLTFMQKRIFDPLRMDDTMPDSLTEPIQDRATFYFPKFAADPRYGPDVMREIDLSCYAGSSAFLSTPSDLVRFALAVNNGTLLQPATVHLLQTSLRTTAGPETGYGLGWDLESVTVAGKQTPWVGHDGDVLGGIVGSLATFPEHGLVVSVIANISYADTPGLTVKIADIFAGQANVQRSSRLGQ